MRHKHADVIHAYAEGAEVELKCPDGTWMYMRYPAFDVSMEYRVKPKEPNWWENIPEHGILVQDTKGGDVYRLYRTNNPDSWIPLTNEEIEAFKR